ncbi:MAG: Peptidase S8 and S53, subtilisin, kexin, sedolisin [Parcubacteria group bacterium GW2011_GWA2_44_12]|nr:MAG: Peptidase S8 and S53, subtilisin, kexin, sedolisin [Parcubacteria group bacterium GW2011_GWA2_44_12]
MYHRFYKIIVLCALFFIFAPFAHVFAEVISVIPNDPLYKEQGYLSIISAPQAWGYITDAKDVVIAVIDSGVAIDHEDLKNNIWTNEDEDPYNKVDDDGNGFADDVHGWDFIDNDNDPHPRIGQGADFEGATHGTIVAGIIAAQGGNGLGVTGVAHRAEIMPIRALDSDGKGNTSNVARAMIYAIENGADIINLSFVGSDFDPVLEKIIKVAHEAGIVVIAAVGNESDPSAHVVKDLNEKPLYPVCYETNANFVIGVGSLEPDGAKSKFSNYGTKCIDINAPGSRIVSTQVFDETNVDTRYDALYSGYWSGTSFSTPLVAGAAALVKAINPLFSENQIMSAILDNADQISEAANPGFEGKLGRGMLNVLRAVRAAAPIGYTKTNSIAAPPLYRRVTFLATAQASGGFPTVGIFSGKTLMSSFMPYPEEKAPSGIRVSQGDVDGDLEDDIVAAPAGNFPSEVRILSQRGVLKHAFMAFSEQFQKGLNVHSADVLPAKGSEIIVASASGESQEVRIFDGTGRLIYTLKPFQSSSGIAVSSINFDDKGTREIEVGAFVGSVYQIKILNESGTIFKERAFAQVKGAARFAVGNIVGESSEETVLTYVQNSRAKTLILDKDLDYISEWTAFNSYALPDLPVSVVYSRLQRGRGKIVFGSAVGARPRISLFDAQGKERGFFWVGNRDSADGLNVG